MTKWGTMQVQVECRGKGPRVGKTGAQPAPRMFLKEICGEQFKGVIRGMKMLKKMDGKT